MKTKDLIDLIKYNELLTKEVCEEIIQRLLEYEELKDLLRQVAIPSKRIAEFLGYLPLR